MGALNNELNQPSSTAATSRDTSDLKVLTPTSSSDKVNRLESVTKFSSFSSVTSSPDSTLDDPFLEFDIEHDESNSTITAIPKHDKQASEHDNKASTTDPQNPKPPVNENHHSPMSSSGPGHVFESPSIQMMERSNNSKYRIPSSVFKRNKSTAPDWSNASNESLFSIQMGGMSFTRDQYNYLRSGELGLSGDPSTGQKLGLSGELSTPHQKLGGKTATNVGKSQELSVGGSKEIADDRKSNVEGRISHYSVGSTSSTNSFAFPVLAGEKERGNSAKIGDSVKIFPETPKIEQQSPSEGQSKTTPAAEAAGEEQPNTPAAAATTKNNWFSCFPCCSKP